MKKRLKIIGTMASLFIAISIMAFGVFASVTANYTITNSVVYNIANMALVDVTRNVYPLKPPTDSVWGASDSSIFLGNSVTMDDIYFSTSETGSEYSEKTYTDSLLYDDDLQADTFDYDFNQSYAYKVVIQINTVNTLGCKYNVVFSNVDDNANVKLTGTNQTNVSLTKGTTNEIVFYVNLINAAKTVGANISAFRVEITITANAPSGT